MLAEIDCVLLLLLLVAAHVKSYRMGVPFQGGAFSW
jgi:hypothetical protein